jgi:nudix-type nucleoside diphosphatase (YffH/AdpP family)
MAPAGVASQAAAPATSQILSEFHLPRLLSLRDIHLGWASFRMATARLEDGKEILREVEDHGRAVAVLPYDAARRVALLVKQLRVPAMVAGCEDMFLEAPAGILDEDDPAACARREALEECGVRLGDVEHVTRAWSMPGISTELIDLYLATYEASDRIEAGGGLADEDEHITVVEMPLGELAAMSDDGRLVDMKTLALVLALRVRKPGLFGP